MSELILILQPVFYDSLLAITVMEEELLFPLTHQALLITDISSHIPLALRVI
jgi:hypothetical protein